MPEPRLPIAPALHLPWQKACSGMHKAASFQIITSGELASSSGQLSRCHAANFQVVIHTLSFHGRPASPLALDTHYI